MNGPGPIVQGNAILRHSNASLLAVTEVLAPVTVTSAQIDAELAPVLKRLRLPKGLLPRVAGVTSRRNWSRPGHFQEGAADAGRLALERAGVRADQIGLMVNTSVTRESLEPSVAVRIHHELGLPTSATNFDITNACLGFVNGMSLAASLIDAGQIDYAMVVAGEDSVNVQRATLENLKAPEVDRDSFMEQFASLTLGSGAAAAVIGRTDQHPAGHRIVRGITRAGTDHHDLCVGDHKGMFTDSAALLKDGLELVMDAWNEVPAEWDWAGMDRYVTHQVSRLHTDSITEATGLDPALFPVTFPELGNVGPASLPITLARAADTLSPGDRVLCMGVGSGLNTAMLELAW